MQGNERENRFANGIPAPGEEHKSILETYLGAKNQSDNATQEDWGNSIKDRDQSSFGQGLGDIGHSGAAGAYGLGSGALRGIQMIEPYVKPHYQMPWQTPQRYTDTRSNIEYPYDPGEYQLYQYRKYFQDQEKQHEQARSEDYKKADLTTPGYLGVKAIGTGIQDIFTLLATGYIIKNMGPAGDIAALALGAVSGKGKSYDNHMDEYASKSEEELMGNEAYRKMREDGLSEGQARFAIGNKHARMNSDVSALAGAVKAFLTAGVGRVTRDGSENPFMKGAQDYVSEGASDKGFETLKKQFKEIWKAFYPEKEE